MTVSQAPEEYKKIVKASVLDTEAFRKLTFSGRIRGEALPWVKVVLSPVTIKDILHIRFQYFDGKKDITKNYRGSEVGEKLDALLSFSFNQVHLQTAEEDCQIRLSRRGKVHITRSPSAQSGKPVDLRHNRERRYPLAAGAPDAFLQFTGLMDEKGRIKPTRQDKYRQINTFLSIVETTVPLDSFDGEKVQIIDCGCGNAYLTLAAYHYLNHVRKVPARIVGIDANGDLIQKCRQMQQDLGWGDLDFVVSRISDFTPDTPPDVVLSLHACDTATDEALARAIHWQSRFIFAAPCCQKELRGQIDAPLFRPVFRHGILKQRTADLLTDACRAQILRMMGYRADVLEFIDSNHTPKNLMIRATKVPNAPDQTTRDEYVALKAFFNIQPALEDLLGTSFQERMT